MHTSYFSKTNNIKLSEIEKKTKFLIKKVANLNQQVEISPNINELYKNETLYQNLTSVMSPNVHENIKNLLGELNQKVKLLNDLQSQISLLVLNFNFIIISIIC
jgi:hypothetical protein